MPSDFLEKANKELILARVHYNEGFPGRSRVCARRAAGAALLYYLMKIQDSCKANNAYEILLFTQSSKIFPPEVQESVHTLTLRVDESFNLPSLQDPILAAQTIITWVITTLSEGDEWKIQEQQ